MIYIDCDCNSDYGWDSKLLTRTPFPRSQWKAVKYIHTHTSAATKTSLVGIILYR